MSAKLAKSRPPGLFADLFAVRFGLKAAWARVCPAASDESRLLAYLMIACFGYFIIRLPDAFVQIGQMDVEVAPQTLVLGQLMGYLIFAPLLFYAIAGLSHLVAARLFGGQGSYGAARLALIWTLLLFLPVMMLQILAGRLLGPHVITGANFAIFLGFLWVWISFLSFAEGFPRGRAFGVMLMLVLVCAGFGQLLT